MEDDEIAGKARWARIPYIPYYKYEFLNIAPCTPAFEGITGDR